MPLFILTIVLQVACAVHAVRTGRDNKWLYFIVLAPMIGCVAYILAEVLPELRHSRTARRANRFVIDKLDPDRQLRESTDRLQVSNNVDNVIEFAEQCVEKGHYDEAIQAYRDAMHGLFEFDPKLMLGLARAQFAASHFADTVTTLDQLIEQHPEFKSADGHLLYARAQESLGEVDRALHEYETLAQYYPGPEAKCRYALLLKRQGKLSLAASLFEDIKLTARRSPKHYSRLHKQWIDIARRET
ncbi:tetratricopeptide repeat protein [Exilibacterium tricleocarpae]|uniref:Tetratricopeptide repeat protein n=1 Tax=Exilibacterium tricleocarpae TaxID=2591008 RepID=A0A545U572_9GAMM|nr:tetratricopeptide repeat protein [Exilibacterium tricleocarpae]TQV84621.1 tetratricopeptide repeat protein [Exilibacterium tricleocarpae]